MFNAVGSHIPGHANTKNPVHDQEVGGGMELRYQQQHGWLGFPLAVLQKYSDDQGSYLAASIAYYGVSAVFPLLLVLTTVLGFLLQGHQHLGQTIANSALGQFRSSDGSCASTHCAEAAWLSASPPRSGPALGWTSAVRRARARARHG